MLPILSMPIRRSAFVVVSLFVPSILGSVNGPPLGWRTWNAFDCSDRLNQSTMESTATVLATERGFGAFGNLTLKDLGFNDVGLDDCWQACGAGLKGGFHDPVSGLPIVDTVKFPSMHEMVQKIHGLGLTASWYGNNCVCSENELKAGPLSEEEVMRNIGGDVRATVAFGFTRIKLDGCGPHTNLREYKRLFEETASHSDMVAIENCHWGADVGNSCPYQFARVSMDLAAGNWESFITNLQGMALFANAARAGCWNYADMLQVLNNGDYDIEAIRAIHKHGNTIKKNAFPGPTGGDATHESSIHHTAGTAAFDFDRAQFSAWCVTSSPLILSFDLNDKTKLRNLKLLLGEEFSSDSERISDSLSGGEVAIAINQAVGGEGDSLGRLVYSWDPKQVYYLWKVSCDLFVDDQSSWSILDPKTGRLGWVVKNRRIWKNAITGRAETVLLSRPPSVRDEFSNRFKPTSESTLCAYIQNSLEWGHAVVTSCDLFGEASNNDNLEPLYMNVTDGKIRTLERSVDDSKLDQCLSGSSDGAHVGFSNILSKPSLRMTDCISLFSAKDRGAEILQTFTLDTTSAAFTQPGRLLSDSGCISLRSSAPHHLNQLQVWTKSLPSDFAATRHLWKHQSTPYKQQAVFFLNSHKSEPGIFHITPDTIKEIFRLNEESSSERIKVVLEGQVDNERHTMEQANGNYIVGTPDRLGGTLTVKMLDVWDINSKTNWTLTARPKAGRFLVIALFQDDSLDAVYT